MEIDRCKGCGGYDPLPVECRWCSQGQQAWLCRACMRSWTCPHCHKKPWAPYALTFALDSKGLPEVVDVDQDGNPPDGAVKIDPSLSDDEIFRLYLTFRREVIERQNLGEMDDPFLAEYGALTREESARATASGGDSQNTGIVDTFVTAPPRELRVMAWNLQDLGGGPSRGPTRSDETIRRIAHVIRELDPDICALLEVKLSGRLPPKPQPPPQPKRTRHTKPTDLDQKLAERQQDYERKLEEWEEAKQRLLELQKSDSTPGAAEVAKIMAALGDGWNCLLDPSMYTEGETYAFIYKTDIAPQAWGLIDEGCWPEKGYRSPARVTFRLSGSRVGRRRGSVDEDWELDVIAYHAPAPNHGEVVHRAIEKFKSITWARETILAGDFNVDTELGDLAQTEKYERLIEAAKTEDEAEYLFDQWASLKFNETLDENRALFESVSTHLQSVLGDGLWVAGWDLERTSLRSKIGPAKEEHFKSGIWASTLAFQNAAYDKIVLFTPSGCDPRLLQASGAFAYPLFERFLPTDLRSRFAHKVIDDSVIHNYREDVIDPGSGSDDDKLQRVLDGVKEVSDHVPVVLELEIHPR